MKSTEVDESLSTTTTSVLFQRKSTSFKTPGVGMGYKHTSNILQRQHYNQTSSHETQGPGPKRKEEWGNLQFPV